MVTKQVLCYLLLIFVAVFAEGKSSESPQKKRDMGRACVRLKPGICESHKHPSNDSVTFCTMAMHSSKLALQRAHARTFLDFSQPYPSLQSTAY